MFTLPVFYKERSTQIYLCIEFRLCDDFGIEFRESWSRKFESEMIGATSPFLAFLWNRAANCGSLANAIDWRETAGRGASPWIHISIIGLGW